MFKAVVLLSFFVTVVYSVPAPPPTRIQLAEEGLRSQVNPSVDASIKAVNGETDPKDNEEALEGAEFGWGFKKFKWGYPSYRSYSYYPTYYYPSYSHYYPSYSSYWW